MKMKGISIILVIGLLLGIGSIPTIVSEYNAAVEAESKNILFEDDFNDNVKDMAKWSEYYNDGTWREMNQRCEFKVYEPGGDTSREGIKSVAIPVMLSKDNYVGFTCDWITDLGSTSNVGNVRMEVTDGTNWIRIGYSRWKNEVRYRDSNDDANSVLESRGDGSWENTIQIYSNKYIVQTDTQSSEPIPESLFEPDASLSVILYLKSAGDFSSIYTISAFDSIEVFSNAAPNTPGIPTGSETGLTFVDYQYSAVTTHPKDNDLYYKFDWGDGAYSNWLGPYESGESITANHQWTQIGTYMISVQAKDKYGGISNWSDSLLVDIGEPELEIESITGGILKSNIVVANNGNRDAENITYAISLNGGLILSGQYTSGSIDSIPAGGFTSISTNPIIGFGNVIVQVEIDDSPYSQDFEDIEAFVFIFILV